MVHRIVRTLQIIAPTLTELSAGNRYPEAGRSFLAGALIRCRIMEPFPYYVKHLLLLGDSDAGCWPGTKEGKGPCWPFTGRGKAAATQGASAFAGRSCASSIPSPVRRARL